MMSSDTLEIKQKAHLHNRTLIVSLSFNQPTLPFVPEDALRTLLDFPAFPWGITLSSIPKHRNSVDVVPR